MGVAVIDSARAFSRARNRFLHPPLEGGSNRLGRFGEGYGACLQDMRDTVKHDLWCLQELAVRKTQHAISASQQPLCSCRIVTDVSILAMLVAIELDNQLCRRTIEIDDIRPNRLLAPKPQSSDLVAAKYRPKLSFGICCGIAKTRGKRLLQVAASFGMLNFHTA